MTEISCCKIHYSIWFTRLAQQYGELHKNKKEQFKSRKSLNEIHLYFDVNKKKKLKCFLFLIFLKRNEIRGFLFLTEMVHSLTLFRMGLFGAAHGWRGQKGPLFPEICHTYPTMMKRGTVIYYLKKTQNIYMNFVTHSLGSADISIFSSEFSKFCYIRKCRYRLQFGTWFLIFLTFFGSLKMYLISMVTILMI